MATKLSTAASEPAIAEYPSVSREGNGVRVSWDGNTSAWFHNYWLRENCHCALCTHQDAWERIVDLRAIPLDIAPVDLQADESGLSLTWATHAAPCDGTHFSWRFLQDNCTESHARRARKVRPVTWRAADLEVEKMHVPHSAFMTSDEGLETALATVDAFGFVIIDDVPTTRDGVRELAERVAFIEESHFGRYFDIEAQVVPENLAYTPRQLAPHNDLPSRANPPGIQLLHCMENTVEGGDSILVDAIAVAERLRSESPEAFEVLATEPVRFTSMADSWSIVNRRPVIQVDEDGDVVGTRFHPALLGPVDVPPERIEQFYRAHRAMLELATDEQMQFAFRLETGQCQMFANERVLHGRQAFSQANGHRHFQGCYIPMDDLRSRLAVLKRHGRDFRTR